MTRGRLLIVALSVFIIACAIVLAYSYHQGKEVDGSDIVAEIEGEPVTYDEFIIHMNGKRGKVAGYFQAKYDAKPGKSFWTTNYGGEVPLDQLKQEAMADLVSAKVTQILAKRKEIVKDIAFETVVRNLNAENKRRAQAKANHETVFGPARYEESEYYRMFNSNLMGKLQSAMAEDELISENELRRYYDENKEKIFKLTDSMELLKLSADSADAKQVLEAIKDEIGSGKDFAAVLAAYKEKVETTKLTFDSSNSHSFSLAYPGLFAELRSLRQGQATEIFMESGAYSIAICVNWKDNGYRTFEEVQEGIRKDMTRAAVERTINDLIRNAEVVIRNEIYDKI